MANPRELAEQAFSLLQDALRDSEARASDLDEQLRRKRAPKTKLEEQLDVLTHRLEAVEAERTRWQQEASHLEEVAEAERTKVAQLRKKLEVAESGPEKLTKKEVNFWRAKAEEFTGETQEYRDRLAGLRREIIERDALIEKLRDGQTQGAPETPPVQPDEGQPTTIEISAQAHADIEGLRARVAEREREVEELQSELAAARETDYNAGTEQSLEIQARIETLSRQVASFDQALNEAHTARATARSELAAARAELEPAQRSAREALAAAERMRAMLEEREQRIVELSAEVESARQRVEAERSTVAEARGDAEQLRTAAAESRQRAEQLDEDLVTARQALAEQSQFAREAAAVGQAAQGALSDLEAQLLAIRANVEAGDRKLEDRNGQIKDLEGSLAEARSEIDRTEREIGRLAGERADNERRAQDSDQRREESERRADALERQLDGHSEQLDERERAQATVSAELEQARAMLEANDRELASMRDTLLGANREIEQLRGQIHQLDDSLAASQSRADDAAARLSLSHDEIRSLEERRAEAERQRDEIASQVAGLEVELKEEKENGENLGEIANERRELLTKLQEKVEEAEERYEDAKYRLTKAAHFERLVKRRKGLVAKLLNALRQKQKANTALKAGLDGLRTYKAGAEMNQQKLLQRIDALKVELKEAEETIARHHGTTTAREELATSVTKVSSLEQRLNAQAEVIQTLENDLKAARSQAKSGDEKNHEIERLHKELETKSKVVAQLQADVDDLQRKLAKLRGSEGETMRLKAATEKDRTEIDALEREVSQLRETLSRQGSGSGAGAASAELESKLRDREQSVTRLMGTIKEHEAAIKKLTESAESWKRKYQFLSSDSPDAYKTSTEPK
jgi:chromosome segregation ATPase